MCMVMMTTSGTAGTKKVMIGNVRSRLELGVASHQCLVRGSIRCMVRCMVRDAVRAGGRGGIKGRVRGGVRSSVS